jgi:group I intron endonuclease
MVKKELQGCIYYVVNKKNGKGYVGQDKSGEPETHRWNQHVEAAHKGSRIYFHRALRKNGYEAGFTWEVVWRGPVSKLDAKETYYIKKFHTFIDDQLGGGYNLISGSAGRVKSKRVIQKHIKAAKEMWARDPERRLKLGRAMRGRTFSAETIQKMSMSQKARFAANPMPPCSEELRALRRKIMQGKSMPVACIEAARKVHKGVPLTAECRMKLSMSTRGVPKTEEHKMKIKAGLRRYWDAVKLSSNSAVFS